MDFNFLGIWLIVSVAWALTGGIIAKFTSGKESWQWSKVLKTVIVGVGIGTIGTFTGQMVTMDNWVTMLSSSSIWLVPFADKITNAIRNLIKKN